MSFFELFSVRNNPQQQTDVFEYDEINQKLRIQISHTIEEILPYDMYVFKEHWKGIEKGLCKELGHYQLGNSVSNGTNVVRHMDRCSNLEYLDCLDYIMHAIKREENEDGTNQIDDIFSRFTGYERNLNNYIDEINHRFRQHSIGYEVVSGQLIRIDNQFMHTEVIKKSIKLLYEEGFSAVSDEFLKAFEHYKDDDYKDAVVNAGKAFESTMKTICVRMGYEYDSQRDTANLLIKRLFDNGFMPSYMQNHVQGLRQALENSAHVLRNKNGGHGQGEVIVDVDDSIVRYTLNLCATNIVFLVERYKESRSTQSR